MPSAARPLSPGTVSRFNSQSPFGNGTLDPRSNEHRLKWCCGTTMYFKVCERKVESNRNANTARATAAAATAAAASGK